MLRDKEVLLKEANHVMTVCNACRYCEGFCAVFPAMELRRMFTVGDMKYFANLCHNCRGCFYACQYAPPHEFDLNIPKTFAELRMSLYREYASPSFMTSLLKKGPWGVLGVSLACVALVFLFALLGVGQETMFGAQEGEAIFYNITPYRWIFAIFGIIFFGMLAAWGVGVAKFWKSISEGLDPNTPEADRPNMWNLKDHITAIKDMMSLKYLGGGGHGCNYPDDAFSNGRRYFHHFVFYGFIGCLIATAVGFFLEHAVGIMHPFPPVSVPVIFGFFGGLSICVGTAGLWYLKGKMDPEPSSPEVTPGDRAFIILVFLVSLSGLLLLFFRSTFAMGSLLTLHLGLVMSFFVLAPYGKMLHGVYRYFALVRNAQEQRRADEKAAAH